jgi:DNA-binding beta-propeller fold protein YncE
MRCWLLALCAAAVIQSGCSSTVNSTPAGLQSLCHVRLNASGSRLYVTNALSNAISVYDQKGDQLTTCGGFPDVNRPGAIAYDSVDQLLYVAMNGGSEPSIVIYDTNGNEIAGHGFPITGGIGLALDPLTRLLYVADAGLPDSGAVRVYDHAGDVVKTSGAFPVTLNPVAIALDTHNSHLYVLEVDGSGPHLGGLVEAFDLVGNPIRTTGDFPGFSSPTSIAFDTANCRLYVTDAALHSMRVYGEEGNLVGRFPLSFSASGGGASAMTFDSSNDLLYVASSNNTVVAYDQSGKVSSTTGAFPNLHDPVGIVAVP